MRKVLLVFAMIASCLFSAGCSSSPPAAVPPVYEDETEAWLQNQIDAFLNDDSTLPDKTASGEAIAWTISSGEAEIRDYAIYKTEKSQEYEPIVLKAEVHGKSYTLDHVLLLDPYVGYVIPYFEASGPTKEQLKLGYTYNGTYWFKLHNDQPVLKPSKGTKRLRDPSFVRKKDGSLELLATQGFNKPKIYAFELKDGTQFTNERLLKVNRSSSELTMSEEQAWAPEGFYDRRMDCYVIYWSSIEDGAMYYNTTSDFRSVSLPSVLFDTGYPIIDGTLEKINGTWVMIWKDERTPARQYAWLYRTLGSDWNKLTETDRKPVIPWHPLEGPVVLKDFGTGLYYIAADDYTRGRFRIFECEDLLHGYFRTTTAEVMVPFEHPGHASAMPVTWKELERLMNHFGAQITSEN